MKLAIMQPYTFPYIGYFQLINAVDMFIFYEDVNFVKKGYINRNRILINGDANLFTIPCKSVSQNKPINQTELNFDDKARTTFLKSIELSYKKAPHFNDFYPLLEDFIRHTPSKTIAEFAIGSVKLVANYLGISTQYGLSSERHIESFGMEKEQRLITITKKENASVYINAIGGTKLYKKSSFEKANLNLYFLQSDPIRYKQFQNDFIENLSIIDVLMFNSQSTVNNLLFSFKLI